MVLRSAVCVSNFFRLLDQTDQTSPEGCVQLCFLDAPTPRRKNGLNSGRTLYPTIWSVRYTSDRLDSQHRPWACTVMEEKYHGDSHAAMVMHEVRDEAAKTIDRGASVGKSKILDKQNGCQVRFDWALKHIP